MPTGLRSFAATLSLMPVLLGSPAHTEPLRFATYGDMPYTDADRAFLAGPALERLAADPAIAFLVSVGDLGRPEDACNDAWQEQQIARWREKFPRPVFYTPGDNDWTDCDRPKLAAPVSELGRLDAVRRLYFSKPPAVDADWRYSAQDGQPENAMWQRAGVQFVTVHVVGTMNGRAQIYRDDPRLAIGLADTRDTANRLWLAGAFKTARANGAKAVVVAMQVDPFDPEYADLGPLPNATPLERCLASSAYGPICRDLVSEVATFAGPVLLIHGDSNPACLEPVVGADGGTLFWRLNNWGDFLKPDIAIVDVDPGDAKRPFRASSLADGGPMPSACRY